ncbi:MAG TPA: glycosyltransferase, partial [Terriglobales bacterium]|nr:glycosyltransferase [Terriglobales bacterium]
MQLAVVIPALNCERTIATVVTGARAHLETIVVVNDGSSDATAAAARAAGAEVIEHHRCRGKGAALLSAMEVLERRGI